jgi:hypothetical protein
MRKVANKKCYRVSNRKSKRVMAKCASKKNAMKQLRLLRAIQYNKSFVPRKSAKKGRLQKGGERTWFEYLGITPRRPESSVLPQNVVPGTQPTAVVGKQMVSAFEPLKN